MYLLSPATAHRFVGYLEEEAVAAYTAFLGAIDKGQIPNVPAPKIARKCVPVLAVRLSLTVLM